MERKTIQQQERDMCSSANVESAQDASYTINDLRAAIPPHCFQSSTIRSLSYILRDVVYAGLLAYAASFLPQVKNDCIRQLCWTTYGILQGLVFTGLWNIAHECGHGALSKFRWFNDGFGLVIHSFLLTPYHSWRYTHQMHHKKTNNLDGDIAFIPPTLQQVLARRRPQKLPLYDLIEDTPIGTLCFLVVYQLLAWPLYLLINNSSLDRIRRYAWWKRSHFYPGGDGPSFTKRHLWGVLVSDLAIATTVLLLMAAMRKFGGWNVVLYYGIPYLWTNHWMVVIVYLQHVDPRLPYYTQSNFTFLRGAASTIDRDFGFVGRHFFHGTVNYHVVHHHFCKIPFYHAREATEAIRKVMGTSYVVDTQKNWLRAFWDNHRSCLYVQGQQRVGVKDEVFYYAIKDAQKTPSLKGFLGIVA